MALVKNMMDTSHSLPASSAHTAYGLTRLRGLLLQQGARQPGSLISAVPPPVMVLCSILSVQLGAALAKGLFASLGSGGTVFLRNAIAALVLLLFWRPRLRGYSRADYLLLAVYGFTLAAMTGTFYAAIARIPLGIASTIEFIGPLGVAVAASRRRLDLLWVGLAGAGVVLLAPLGGNALDPLGIGLALLAALFWACYILLNVRVGRIFPGGNGLALGMGISAVLMFPFGAGSAATLVLNPALLLLAVGVALLSTVIPFSLELEALRRLPARVFGILMSLEPAIAALIGFLVLGETTGLRGLLALVLIVLASGGASFFQQT